MKPFHVPTPNIESQHIVEIAFNINSGWLVLFYIQVLPIAMSSNLPCTVILGNKHHNAHIWYRHCRFQIASSMTGPVLLYDHMKYKDSPSRKNNWHKKTTICLTKIKSFLMICISSERGVCSCGRCGVCCVAVVITLVVLAAIGAIVLLVLYFCTQLLPCKYIYKDNHIQFVWCT